MFGISGLIPRLPAVTGLRTHKINDSINLFNELHLWTRTSLGLMSKLIGRWSGNGFNLIARPNFHDSTNLYLQLNKTLETFKVEPIGSPIPNRGFGQDDIQLFGAHSLQQITDAGHDGALHIEPGLWVTQGPTVYPPESPPAGAQIIYRMGSIPHGNALLAQGIAETFSGPPTLKSGTIEYSFSRFPSFNSTPFVIPLVGAPVMNADGTSEKLSAAANGVPPFTPYDVTIPASLANPRTPFDTSPPEPALPAALDGVAMQDVINDPIRLLQKRVQDQVDDGCTFEGVVFNIATQNSFTFLDTPNGAATGPDDKRLLCRNSRAESKIRSSSKAAVRQDHQGRMHKSRRLTLRYGSQRSAIPTALS